ncbi:hypothetical protein AB0N14_09860 [Streptomyces sp. NPDC051104]|uniref:hypothetical protein n=1 Tax=Streptomyces sp. NPDC051104 TaxID=3155044 RepID=UPI00344920D9
MVPAFTASSPDRLGPRPADERASALRAILSAMPSGDTRNDPEAPPHRQRVRAAVTELRTAWPFQAVPARWNALDEVPWPDSGPGHSVSLRSVTATACAPIRFELDNPYTEHRPYPSARCKFPVRVVTQDATGDWLHAPELEGFLGVPSEGTRHPEGLETFSALAALPAFYGPLRPVLAGLETGHVLASLALLGRALGRPLEVSGAAEHPPPWADHIPGPVLPGYRMADAAAADREPEAGYAPDQPSWSRVVWDRNSGRVPKGISGFTGGHRTLPIGAWRTALSALSATTRGLGPLAEVRQLLGVHCLVRRVEGIEDGIYEISFDGTARRMGDVSAARGCLLVDAAPAPRLAFELDACNLVWVFSANTATACRASSEPAERIAAGLLAAAGWTAQHLSYAMAALGLFARPLRSFHGGPTALALGLGASHVPVYQLACGLGRYTEPGIDVRGRGPNEKENRR